MPGFRIHIPLVPNKHVSRSKTEEVQVCTTDTASHLNIISVGQFLSLMPNEAKKLRDALTNAYPVEPETFSTIAKGDTVTVSLTVTKVDTRHGTTMFSTDCPEWFEAHDAIGYVAPLRTPIEAGQVRQLANRERYNILVTPHEDDQVVVCRARVFSLGPILLNRSEVEAGEVITP